MITDRIIDASDGHFTHRVTGRAPVLIASLAPALIARLSVRPRRVVGL
ncbi:hypothetical protein QF035_003213 [Streptomyces umbrinus]|uniref:Uncharacterized protein n=1 Tax=Streptomyces umbrinus TaxID=67370 RepID=A0ABU0SSG3_9ACTN|nr:hypothetical protein [Streptomyces umbrinus]